MRTIEPHPRFQQEIAKSMPYLAALFRPNVILVDESGALVDEPTAAARSATPLHRGPDGRTTRDFIIPCAVNALTAVVGEDRVRTFGGSTTITRARVAVLLAGVFAHVRESDLLVVYNPEAIKNPGTDGVIDDTIERNPVYYNIISSDGNITIGLTEMRAERIT